MPVWAWILIGILAVVVVGLVVWSLRSRQRTGQLRDRFGPEYERVVDEHGDRREAESELTKREERYEELEIRPLPPASRRRYLDSWRNAQARFVDAPNEAVAEADRLVTDVMTDRGYPMEDFDQRAEVISVDHAHLVRNYRSAHAISVAAAEGNAKTEDLRKAMIRYRSLFEELLQDGDGLRAEAG